MNIFQSILLALGFVGMTWLFVVIGKGVRLLGRKRRARKATSIDERVSSELSAGEQLIWVDSWRAQPVMGAFLMLIGFLFSGFWTTIAVCQCLWAKPGSQTGVALAICIPFACFGLFVFYCGIYVVFLQAKNYLFVTSKRLAIRKKSFAGKRIAWDVKPGQLKKVELVHFRLNGIHVHDRVRVMFEDDEYNARKVEILPERNPGHLANAINMITSVAVTRMEEMAG